MTTTTTINALTSCTALCGQLADALLELGLHVQVLARLDVDVPTIRVVGRRVSPRC